MSTKRPYFKPQDLIDLNTISFSIKMDIGYIRISNKSEDVRNQEYALEKFAGRELKFFYDEQISGITDISERQGYTKMLEYIKEKHPEKLYVYETSRLSRDFYQTLALINMLENKYGVMVLSVSPKEQMLNQTDPAMRKIFLAFIAWGHERSRDDLIARTRNSLEAIKSEIKHQGFHIVRHGKNAGKKIIRLGKPEREIDWKQVDEYRKQGISYSNICILMKYNYKWFLGKKKAMNENTS